MHQPNDNILNGKFRIERLLGRGAFGEVYLATHLLLNAPRAVKVLRRDAPGVGGQEFALYRERFAFEAQLGARLDHPNVVKVYDFEAADGELHLVMEYCAGGSLADRLAEGGPLSVEGAVRMGLDLCDGLEAIHERLKAVHRDLKPSNILFDMDGRAKVGDLGLAQTPASGSRGSLLGSFATAQPGTPAYMSPEQEVSRGYLLPSSDIFALGCVLFEALTGELYKARYGDALREVRADAPERLEAIVARALQEAPGRLSADDADPRKRYRRAGQMRGDLTRWLAELEEAQRKAAEAERQRLAAAQAAERARLQQAKEERDLRRATQQAEAALSAGQWQEAAEIARQWLKVRPAHPQLQQASDRANRSLKANDLRRDAEAALAAENWSRARRLAEEWLGLAPGNADAQAARDRAEQGAAEEARRARVGELARAVEVAASAENWLQIRKLAAEWLRLAPGDPAAEAAGKRAARELQIQDTVASYHAAAGKGDWDEALRQASKWMALKPDEAAARSAGLRAEAELKRIETEKALAAGDWDAAKTSAQAWGALADTEDRQQASKALARAEAGAAKAARQQREKQSAEARRVTEDRLAHLDWAAAAEAARGWSTLATSDYDARGAREALARAEAGLADDARRKRQEQMAAARRTTEDRLAHRDWAGAEEAGQEWLALAEQPADRQAAENALARAKRGPVLDAVRAETERALEDGRWDDALAAGERWIALDDGGAERDAARAARVQAARRKAESKLVAGQWEETIIAARLWYELSDYSTDRDHARQVQKQAEQLIDEKATTVARLRREVLQRELAEGEADRQLPPQALAARIDEIRTACEEALAHGAWDEAERLATAWLARTPGDDAPLALRAWARAKRSRP